MKTIAKVTRAGTTTSPRLGKGRVALKEQGGDAEQEGEAGRRREV